MSTPQTRTRTGTAWHDQPTKVFKRCIAQNREVCTNCFRRIRAVQPAPDDDYWAEHAYRTHNGFSTTTLKTIVGDRTIRPVGAGETVHPGDRTDTRGVVIDGGVNYGVVACGACGQLGGRYEANRDPRSIPEMVAAGERLAARLDEVGVEFDADVLFDRIRTGKRLDSLTNKDFVIFEKAVGAAVDAAAADVES